MVTTKEINVYKASIDSIYETMFQDSYDSFTRDNLNDFLSTLGRMSTIPQYELTVLERALQIGRSHLPNAHNDCHSITFYKFIRDVNIVHHKYKVYSDLRNAAMKCSKESEFTIHYTKIQESIYDIRTTLNSLLSYANRHIRNPWSRDNCSCYATKRIVFFKTLVFYKRLYDLFKMPDAQFGGFTIPVGLNKDTLDVIHMLAEQLDKVVSTADNFRTDFVSAIDYGKDIILVASLATGMVLSVTHDHRIGITMSIGSGMLLLWRHYDKVKDILLPYMSKLAVNCEEKQIPEAQAFRITPDYLSTIVNGLATSLIIGMFNESRSSVYDFCKDSIKTYCNRIKTIDMTSDIFSQVSDIFIGLINYVSNMLCGKPIMEVEEEVDMFGLRDYGQRVKELDLALCSGEKAFNNETYARFVELYNLGDDIEIALEKSLIGRKYVPYLKTIQSRITKIRAGFASQNFNSPGMRQVPMCAGFFSGPGTGKSLVIKMLKQDVGSACFSDTVKEYWKHDYQNMFWAKPKSNKHDDNYAGHPGATIDDFGDIKDSAQNPDPSVQCLIDWINSEPHHMNMAHLHDKGRLFQSTIVFLTSNKRTLSDCESLTEIGALKRRINPAFKIIVKNEFALHPEKDSWYNVPDFDLFERDAEGNVIPMTDHYEFHLLDLNKVDKDTGDYCVTAVMDYDKAVTHMIRCYKRKEQDYKGLLKYMSMRTPREYVNMDSTLFECSDVPDYLDVVFSKPHGHFSKLFENRREGGLFYLKKLHDDMRETKGPFWTVMTSAGKYIRTLKFIVYGNVIKFFELDIKPNMDFTLQQVDYLNTNALYYIGADSWLGRDLRVDAFYDLDKIGVMNTLSVKGKVSLNTDQNGDYSFDVLDVDDVHIDLPDTLSFPDAQAFFSQKKFFDGIRESFVTIFPMEEHDLRVDMNDLVGTLREMMLDSDPIPDLEVVLKEIDENPHSKISELLRRAYIALNCDGDSLFLYFIYLADSDICFLDLMNFSPSDFRKDFNMRWLKHYGCDSYSDMCEEALFSMNVKEQLSNQIDDVEHPYWNALKILLGVGTISCTVYGAMLTDLKKIRKYVEQAMPILTVCAIGFGMFFFFFKSRKSTIQPKAQGIPTDFMDNTEDKTLRDIQRKVTAQTYELLSDDRRVCYVLFYGTQRFVTNKHCIDLLLKRNAGRRDTVLTFRNVAAKQTTFDIYTYLLENNHSNDEYDICVVELPRSLVTPKKDLRNHFTEKCTFPDEFNAMWLVPSKDILESVDRIVRPLSYERERNAVVRKFCEVTNTYAYKSEETIYRSTQGFFYKNVQEYGDCGAPLLAKDKRMQHRRIIGIHASKGGIGYDSYATYVGKDILMELDSKFQNNFIVSTLDVPEAQAVDDFIVYGKNKNQIKCVDFSNQMETPYKDLFGSSGLVPSKMNVKMSDLTKRYNKHRVVIPEKPLIAATRSAIYHVFGSDVPRIRLKKSFGEAIWGGSECFKPLNLSTSAGVPYIWDMSGAGGKKHIIGDPSKMGEYILNNRIEIYDYIYDTEPSKQSFKTKYNISYDKDSSMYMDLSFYDNILVLVRDIKKWIYDAQTGCFEPPVFADYPKDEVLKEGKATRVFSCSPLWFTIIMRMYLGSLSEIAVERRIDNGIAVGVNPYSEEWDKVGRKLKQFPNVSATDFKEFDTSALGQIVDQIGIELQFLFDVDPLVIPIFYSIAYSLHAIGYCIVVWGGGMPSGNPWTTLINCLIQHILFRLCYMYIMGSMSSLANFDKHVYLITMGDDGVRSVSNEIVNVFTCERITDLMLDFGYKMTSDVKDGISSYGTIDDVSFLKRTFVKSSIMGRYIAPLKERSLLKMLYFTRNKPDWMNVVKSNIDLFMYEASYHGEEFFYDRLKKINNHSSTVGFEPCKVVDWEEAVKLNSRRIPEYLLHF